MSLVKVTGNASGTGTLTIAAPNTNSNYTLTIPTTTGTIITNADSGTVSQTMLASGVAGNGPAFSAYRSGSSQSISGSTWTKVQFQSEEFDTASCYDNSTNYRFTPTVAGYYQFNSALTYGGTISRALFAFWKNGSESKRANDLNVTGLAVAGSALIYCNGSTDYVEVYAYVVGSSITVNPSSGTETYFQGFLVRAA